MNLVVWWHYKCPATSQLAVGVWISMDRLVAVHTEFPTMHQPYGQSESSRLVPVLCLYPSSQSKDHFLLRLWSESRAGDGEKERRDIINNHVRNTCAFIIIPGLDSRRVWRLVEVDVVPKIGVFKLIPWGGRSWLTFSLSNLPNSGSTTRTASPWPK